jgi:manganese/iron transport system substrate-binding protein
MKTFFNNQPFYRLLSLLVLLYPVLVTGCRASPDSARPGDHKPVVVATTSILGDVVQAIAGDAITVEVLIPIGIDPHSFDPVPRDIATLDKAGAVFVVGLGYESFLEPLLKNVEPDKVISVSSGIQTLSLTEGDIQGVDPHVWFNPLNVGAWADRIASSLSEIDPNNEEYYLSNAGAYRAEMLALDDWARTQVAQIPPESRVLVTDHDAFGYFADRYGFVQAGAVIPGFSTMAEPSAQELAALEDRVKGLGVDAIFVGISANPALSERVANDTGMRLVFVYTESLSEDGGDVQHYPDFFRYNVNAIVETLQ